MSNRDRVRVRVRFGVRVRDRDGGNMRGRYMRSHEITCALK